MTARLLGGGGLLLHRLAAWWTADGIKAAAARLLGTLAAAAFVGGLLLAAPILWWPLAGTWLIASWCATPDADEAELADDEDEEDEDTAAEFLADLHRLMPNPGDRLHVAQIAEQLFGSATEAPRVRELCAAADVPITPVRVKGRGSSTGVKQADLPVVGVVAAGHSDNNNADGLTREGFYSIPHPTEPARTEVRWITEKAS